MIRLSRVGKKKHPLYRVIVSEKTKDTTGDYLELLGTYNPHTRETNLKVDRVKHWLSHGAQASGTVHNLLVDQKLVTTAKVKVANIKKKAAPEGESKPAAAPAAPATPPAAA